MPAYRAAATLARTIDSLRASGPRISEIIVVVSGEGDRPEAAADLEWGGDVHVIRSVRRLSAGAARNLGRAQAGVCDYLLFVDADCAPAAGAIERMLDSAVEQDADIVGAAVVGTGAGVVGWVRHLLEFKDAELGEAVVSATMLCRVAAIDGAGGFPDMWPGEDLVLRERISARGGRVIHHESAVTEHAHPAGFLTLLRHQYRLGRTSALARGLMPMPGSWWLTHASLVSALTPGRGLRAALWLLRNDIGRLPLFILALPLYVAGLMSWTIGFARVARQCE